MTELDAIKTDLDTAYRRIRELEAAMASAHKLELMNAATLDVVNEANTELRQKVEDLEGTVGTREAELGETRGRLEEIDRARLTGVKMCQEKDDEIAFLRMRLESDTRRMNEALEDASKWNGIAIARKKLVHEVCDLVASIEDSFSIHIARRAKEIRTEVESRDFTDHAQWLIQQVCRPPMACYTCEQHNEELCTLINVMSALCLALDLEVREAAEQGRPWNTQLITNELQLFHARGERLSTPLKELLARVTDRGAGDPIFSDEDYETLLKSMGRRPIKLPDASPVAALPEGGIFELTADTTVYKEDLDRFLAAGGTVITHNWAVTTRSFKNFGAEYRNQYMQQPPPIRPGEQACVQCKSVGHMVWDSKSRVKCTICGAQQPEG